MKYLLKRIAVLVVLLISSNGILNAQLTPEFEFDIYVENDLGYIDRVTIGYDERANLMDIEPQFGEANIDTLLIQGELEARIYRLWNHQTKKQIFNKYVVSQNYDSTMAVIFATFDIQIYSNNSPHVTISWDSTLFDISNPANDPHDNSVFFERFTDYISYPEPQYSGVFYEHFLRDHNTLEIDVENTFYRQYLRETELHQFDTVTVVNLLIANYSMWELDSIRNAVPITEAEAKALSIYPTLATNTLIIESEYSIDNYVIINRLGQYMQIGREPILSGEITELDISHLSSGAYSILFFTEGGLVRSRRFVVQRE